MDNCESVLEWYPNLLFCAGPGDFPMLSDSQSSAEPTVVPTILVYTAVMQSSCFGSGFLFVFLQVIDNLACRGYHVQALSLGRKLACFFDVAYTSAAQDISAILGITEELVTSYTRPLPVCTLSIFPQTGDGV